MILKNKPALLIGIVLCIMGCSINLNPKENRIFVVEEKYIDGVNSFFWFKGTGQITHEGLSYFQIAKDKCDLSFKNANAYCNEALQVYEIKSDTVFILAQSEIKTIKSNEKIYYKNNRKMKTAGFSNLPKTCVECMPASN